MPIILAFGDSITYGSWDRAHSGWCALLRKHIDAKNNEDPNFYGRVYNLGIPGETTEMAVKRFVPEVKARLRDDEENIFIISFGANDACFIPSTQKFNVTVEEFAKNIEQMVAEAKKFSSKIILLSITPVIDELTVNQIENDKSRLNKYYEKYNQKLLDIAEMYGLVFIDTNRAFQTRDYAKLLDNDGLHPNEHGQQLLFELISERIDELSPFF